MCLWLAIYSHAQLRCKDQQPTFSSATHFWYHLTDTQFSTVAIIDSVGKLLERVSYTAGGEARHHHRGDLNGDGGTSSTELSTINTLGLFGGTAITSANYNPNADLDCSGTIDSRDYSLVSGLGAQAAVRRGQISGNWVAPSGGGAPSSTDNIVGYCGYLFNGECGLYSVRFRVYDPVTMRWLTRDPAGYVDGMNSYGYVRGNPLYWRDPLGLWGVVGDVLAKLFGFEDKFQAQQLVGEAVAETAESVALGVIEEAIKPQSLKDAEFAAEVFAIENNATRGDIDPLGLIMTGFAVKTGMQQVANGWAGIDMVTLDKLDGTERASLILLGSSQGLGLAAGTAGALSPAMVTDDVARAAASGSKFGKAAAKFDDVGAPKACKGPPCFPPGTLVLMADGTTKPIEELNVGEVVWADDPEDELPAMVYRIDAVHSNYTLRLIHIRIDSTGDGVADGELQATGKHEIWTENDGWQFAETLRLGDKLRSRSGPGLSTATVIDTRQQSVGSKTFNLSVNGVQTFFVVDSSGTSVLVHNQNAPIGPYRDFLFPNPPGTQNHHIIQDAWVKRAFPIFYGPLNLRGTAPAIQLQQDPIHESITQQQSRFRAALQAQGLDPYGTSLSDEMKLAEIWMRNAGMAEDDIQRALKSTREFFENGGKLIEWCP